MSSGMNTEQAKEYAKTMTYTEAVSNIKHAKGIKYRKATMIKIRELAEIADRLDRKTEPNCSEKPNNSTISKMEQVDKDINVRSKDCETCKHYKLACELFSEICKYEPTTQTETQNSNLTFEKADEPQTDCAWK